MSNVCWCRSDVPLCQAEAVLAAMPKQGLQICLTGQPIMLITPLHTLYCCVTLGHAQAFAAVRATTDLGCYLAFPVVCCHAPSRTLVALLTSARQPRLQERHQRVHVQASKTDVLAWGIAAAVAQLTLNAHIL